MSSIMNGILKVLFCSAAFMMASSADCAAKHKKHKSSSSSSSSSSSESACDIPEGPCAPDVRRMIEKNPTYNFLFGSICEQTDTIMDLLSAVTDCESYDNLFNFCSGLASTIPNGRIIVTLPDGTVVVDTFQAFCDCDTPDCPVDFPCDVADNLCNGYNFFLDNFVGANQNTSVSAFDAQLWPCGVGCETRFDLSSGSVEAIVAVRLGEYLNNTGTVIVSQSILGGGGT
jgi:hypothetical protein